MIFEVSTTVSVLDQETDELKRYDEWTDADFERAHEQLSEWFAMGIAVPFTEVSNSRNSILKADENYGVYQMQIEVDEHAVMEELGMETVDHIVNPNDDYVEADIVWEPHLILIEGEVYGRRADQEELVSRVYQATRLDTSEVRFHGGWETSPDEETWHIFSAEVYYDTVLAEDFSESDYEEAVRTGEGGIRVEFVGW